MLTTPELRKMWEDELAGMRVRIKQMRGALVERLAAAGVKQDLSFITRQKGMFSYSGLNAAQMQRPALGIRHLWRGFRTHLRGPRSI